MGCWWFIGGSLAVHWWAAGGSLVGRWLFIGGHDCSHLCLNSLTEHLCNLMANNASYTLLCEGRYLLYLVFIAKPPPSPLLPTKKKGSCLNVCNSVTANLSANLFSVSGNKMMPIHVWGNKMMSVHVWGNKMMPVHVWGNKMTLVHVSGNKMIPVHVWGNKMMYVHDYEKR